jgi:pantoate--beta-alanine ligase
VREHDGLALSSRNRYLSPGERQAAPMLYRVLKECAETIAAGAPIAVVLEKGRNTLAQAGFRPDYLEARHADTLAPLTGSRGEPIRLLVAARLGKTRLIDNVAV